MRPPFRHSLAVAGLLLLAVTLLASACAPAAAPTPTPTKAPAATAAPAATPTTAAAKSEPTKPAAAPAATPTTAAAKPTGAAIKVGYLTPLTGPTAQYGFTENVGTMMGQDEVNNSGGINGSPLQLIRYDSPFDPKQAVTLVRKLATEDKALAILGPFSSGELDVAAPLANELQIPLIGMKSSKPGVSALNRPWQFRITITDDKVVAAAIAAFKKKFPNVKKVLVVGDVKDSGTENLVNEIWPKYLKDAGYDVQGTVGYQSGTTDFSAIVTKIKDQNPEAIAISAALAGNPVGLAKELYAQQVKAPVMSTQHILIGPAVPQAAKEMEGWLSAVAFDPDNTDPKIQQFMKSWQAKIDADNNIVKPAGKAMQMSEYDAVLVLADVMRKAKIAPDMPAQDARTKIKDGLQSLKDFKALTGSATMTAEGDVSWPGIPVQISNGTWQVIK